MKDHKKALRECVRDLRKESKRLVMSGEVSREDGELIGELSCRADLLDEVIGMLESVDSLRETLREFEYGE